MQGKFLQGIVAAVPARRANFLFGNRGHFDFRPELIKERAPAELLAGDHRRDGAGAGAAAADHFEEQVEALAKVVLVAEVEWPLAIARAPAPVGELIAQFQALAAGRFIP